MIDISTHELKHLFFFFLLVCVGLRDRPAAWLLITFEALLHFFVCIKQLFFKCRSVEEWETIIKALSLYTSHQLARTEQVKEETSDDLKLIWGVLLKIKNKTKKGGYW